MHIHVCMYYFHAVSTGLTMSNSQKQLRDEHEHLVKGLLIVYNFFIVGINYTLIKLFSGQVTYVC